MSGYNVVMMLLLFFFSFFFSSRRRHTRLVSDWSSDVCSSDLYHLHQHFDFVITVGPFAQDREAEVDLGRGFEREFPHRSSPSLGDRVKAPSSTGTFTSTSSYTTVRPAFRSGLSMTTFPGTR